MVKGPAQYKFGPAYRYHLSLVTKKMIKVYKQVVRDFIRFLQIYLCLWTIELVLPIKFMRRDVLWSIELVLPIKNIVFALGESFVSVL